ncbi:MAG: hypothetical protein COA69_09575 [Robiginitomaculum sp.]|nr:MAG: hypothetical protein COA69_09575 [Robiginitomaculum sp.]
MKTGRMSMRVPHITNPCLNHTLRAPREVDFSKVEARLAEYYLKEATMTYHDRDETEFHFSNRYGSVTLKAVSEVISIKEIGWASTPEECYIADEDAPKIILITENSYSSLGFETPLKNGDRWYSYVYVSSNEVIRTRVVDLDYCGPEDAMNRINTLNSYQSEMMK